MPGKQVADFSLPSTGRSSSHGPARYCKQFDVMKLKNMYGKKVRGIGRSTLVIAADGVLAREWRGVKVPGHAQEVLNFAKAL
jgi:peroxiredoxin Q/BCP